MEEKMKKEKSYSLSVLHSPKKTLRLTELLRSYHKMMTLHLVIIWDQTEDHQQANYHFKKSVFLNKCFILSDFIWFVILNHIYITFFNSFLKLLMTFIFTLKETVKPN